MPNFTTNSAKGWAPDQQFFAPEDVVPEALVLRCSTVAGSIEGDEPVIRVPYADDAEAQFTAEGSEIPEDTPDLSEVLVATGKLTQLIRVSREQMSQEGASPRLTTSISRAVTRAGNVAFLSQAAPSSPAITPPAGILNVSGVTAGGEVDGDLDLLSDALVGIQEANGNASHILASPSAFGRLSKMKAAADSAVTLLGSGVEASERRLLGLPVIVDNAVPSNTIVALDQTAVVSAVGPVLLATSTDAYFSQDSVGVRCTWRLGQNLVHPDRVATLTVADPAGES